MKLSKRIIALFMIPVLVLSITLVDIKKTYAIEPIGMIGLVGTLVGLNLAIEESELYQGIYNSDSWSKLREGWEEAVVKVGLPHVVAHSFNPFNDNYQELKKYFKDKKGLTEDPTEEECQEYCKQMYLGCHFGDNNFEMSNDFADFIKWYGDQIIDANKVYYGFSLDIQYYTVPDAITTFVQENQDKFVWLRRVNNVWVVAYDDNLEEYGLVLTGQSDFNYSAWAYSYNTFDRYVSFDPGYNAIYPSNAHVFNLENGVLVQKSQRDGGFNHRHENYIFMNRAYSFRETDFAFPNYVNTTNWILVSCGKWIELPIYGSYALFQSTQRGELPYYETNTWNDFSNRTTNTTWNITPQTINPVTYPDIEKYITENPNPSGGAPYLPQIRNWIEEETERKRIQIQLEINPSVNPIPSTVSGNSSGGASATANATANNGGVNITNNNNPVINFVLGGSGTVSDNTVSGNSSGGSGINFGFLGTLGSTLKSLIENIGTAIVDVITGISTVIAEVVTNIPTVFGDFVGAVLGWLPPELQALISLSVVAMVTFGIIKLIRG